MSDQELLESKANICGVLWAYAEAVERQKHGITPTPEQRAVLSSAFWSSPSRPEELPRIGNEPSPS